MRLVDDHAAEAEVAEPADVAVEHLVVDDDDVREAVDGVSVAVDHGGGPLRRPGLGLASPVGLHDVRYYDEQRVRVCGLRGEQGLGGLAQPWLVGQQEGPMAGRGRGDHLRLVRHQFQAGRDAQGRGVGQGFGCRSGGVLEGLEQGADQLPAGQPSRPRLARRGRTEVGGEEGICELPGDNRLRHDAARGRRGGDLRFDRRRSLGGRLHTGGQLELALERDGALGHDGVLGEQREERGVASGGLGEDRRDPVEASELLGAVRVGGAPVSVHAGAFLAHQQGDDLELRPDRGPDGAALNGRLDLPHRLGKDRDEAVGVNLTDPAATSGSGMRSA